MQGLFGYRYLAARRSAQILIIFLLSAGNLYGWKVLQGNLSSSKLFDTMYLVDPFAFLQISAAGALVSRPAIIGAGIVFTLFALLGGRMFCSWVCPMNVVTDLAAWLRERPSLGPFFGECSLNRNIRYWAAGLALLLSTITGIAAFEWISPVSTLHRGLIYGMGAGWCIIAAIFLFDLFLVKDGFCGHVCPLGAFYALASRYSLLRVRHSRDRCTFCMKCIRYCPESQVLPMVGKRDEMVISGECTNCGKCIEVCDERAMGFSLRSVTTRH